MWIYKCINKLDKDSPRFVLGEVSDKTKSPLVCFGINPSTAVPKRLERTLTQVQKRAKRTGYDGWIMFNLYPQRATNPINLHKELENNIHRKNLRAIKKIFSSYPNSTVWAAWGGVINKRAFLKDCLRDILSVVPKTVLWVQISDKKHPHHPLYLKKDLPFKKFYIDKYLSNMGISNE